MKVPAFDRVFAEAGSVRALCASLVSARRGGRPAGLDADQLIAGYEGWLTTRASDRRRKGAFYTPPALVDWVLDGVGPHRSLLDPTCGAGRFLLAALRRSRSAGVPVAASVAGLSGWDLDADAICVARTALWLEAGDRDAALPDGVHVGDAFAQSPDARFDVVVGNPPFLGQLRRDTAVDRIAAAARKARWPGVVGAYTDPAALLLLAAADFLAPGGRLAMVQPQSVLVARDARGVRTALAERLRLAGLWVAGQPTFPDSDAAVCVVSFVRGPARVGPVARYRGPAFSPQPPVDADMDALAAAATWGPLVPAGAGAPPSHRAICTGRVGDHATCTADFRDAYYGILPGLIDAPEGPHPPALTTGLVDPARTRWGTRTARIGKQPWQTPRVDLGRCDANTRAWAETRLRPKLVLATQSRVLEVFGDPEGRWLPVTPLVSIFPAEPARLWHLAAALSSPVVCAWALAHFPGAGLSATALKLSAAQVREAPLPAEGPAWDRAARCFQKAQAEPAARHRLLDAAATASCEAYGVDPAPLVAWWRARRP